MKGHTLIRLLVVTLLFVMAMILMFGCQDQDNPAPEPKHVTYAELMPVFDRVGRNKPLTYTQIGTTDFWYIEFANKEKYRIDYITKDMICTSMPQHC